MAAFCRRRTRCESQGQHRNTTAPTDTDQLHLTRAALTEGSAALPGAWIEDKGYGMALHYREAPQHEAAARWRLVERVAAGFQRNP